MYAQRIETTSDKVVISKIIYPAASTHAVTSAEPTHSLPEIDPLRLERAQLLKSLDATGDCV